MHAVLYGQHGSFITGQEQSLEQRPRVVSLQGIIAIGRSWQLVLITDENDTLRVEVEWDQARGLSRLASFVDDKIVNLAPHELKTLNTRH